MKNTKKYLTLTGITILVAAAFHSLPTFAETAKYQAHIGDALQVTIPSNLINVTVDPASRPFDSKSFSITVATNNSTGYYMSMSSDSTSLTKTDDSARAIPTLSLLDGGYTEETFEANRWGYKLGAGNYIPFTQNAQIASSDTTTNGDTTTLTFATKVDFNQPHGVYENSLEFTVVANPSPQIIQNLDTAFCTEEPTIVIDARDGEEYMIQRLADGKCWMLDNLRFDPSQATLSAMKDKTNAPNEALEYLKNGGGNGKYPEKGLDANEGGYTSPSVTAQYKDIVMEGNPGIGSNKVGVYYNFCAASAGTYCYEDNVDAPDAGNAVYDICPAGWRIPKGRHTYDSNSGDFGVLYDILSMSDFNFVTALSLTSTGHENPSSSSDTGYYWTSTRSTRDEMYIVQPHILDSGTGASVVFSEDKYRDSRRAVRCIMEERTLGDITYMQETTPRIVENTADGVEVTLKDYRDSQEYTVAKETVEVNGHYTDQYEYVYDHKPVAIMTRNLAVGCNGSGSTYGDTATGAALNYATSNLDKNWSTPTSALQNDTDPHMECDTTYGAWYNYYAASAESMVEEDFAGYFTRLVTDYDVCPRGWNLLDSDSVEAVNMHKENFLAQAGGLHYYNDDGHDTLYPDHKVWWTDHKGGGTHMQYVDRYGRFANDMQGLGEIWFTGPNDASGMHVRCVSADK